MNIIQLICSTGFYGAERWVLALANNLDASQVRCDVVAISEEHSANIELLDHYPADIGETLRVEMNGRFDFKVIQHICKIVKERNIDLIHTHGYKSDIIGLMCAKKCRIKCISTPHGFGNQLDWKLKLYTKIGCFSFRYMDAVVPLSDQLYDSILGMGIRSERVKLIKNGVDLSEIGKSILPGSNSSSKPGKTIGYVGRLVPGKEVQEILYLFEQLWSENGDLNLTIVGDGELREELEKLAGALKSNSHIQFLGFRDDRLKLMQSFDMFVMTSSSEGTPRCLMEAMAVEIPIVAYSIPGVRQLIVHEKTGLLADYGNRDELIAQARRLLDNPDFAAILAASGRDYVVDNFSGQRMAREYTHLFGQVLGRKVEHG